MGVGCGGDSGAVQENTTGAAPRGEDDMKAQMEILQKKGLLQKAPGVPRNVAGGKKS
jgi:hypothetical protein